MRSLAACWMLASNSNWVASLHAMAGDAETPPSFECAISTGETLHDKTRGIAVDPAGNILLTGEFTGTVTFGEQALTAVGAMDFFVAKVDPNGKFLKFLWVRSGGGDLPTRSCRTAKATCISLEPAAEPRSSATTRSPIEAATTSSSPSCEQTEVVMAVFTDDISNNS